MSVFHRFWGATKRSAVKVADKAEELVDSARVTFKIKNLEVKIDEKYEDLGRLVYRDLHTDENLEDEKLRLIAEIDGLFDSIAELKTQPETVEAENAAKPEEEEKAPE